MDAMDAPDPFATELCGVMVGANIPFSKLDNKGFNAFLRKYCGRNIPSRQSLSINYLKRCYQEVFLS